jgi:hypothetical protein
MDNPVVLQSVHKIREVAKKARTRRIGAEELLVVEACLQSILLETKPPPPSWWDHAINLFDKGIWGPRDV